MKLVLEMRGSYDDLTTYQSEINALFASIGVPEGYSLHLENGTGIKRARDDNVEGLIEELLVDEEENGELQEDNEDYAADEAEWQQEDDAPEDEEAEEVDEAVEWDEVEDYEESEPARKVARVALFKGEANREGSRKSGEKGRRKGDEKGSRKGEEKGKGKSKGEEKGRDSGKSEAKGNDWSKGDKGKGKDDAKGKGTSKGEKGKGTSKGEKGFSKGGDSKNGSRGTSRRKDSVHVDDDKARYTGYIRRWNAVRNYFFVGCDELQPKFKCDVVAQKLDLPPSADIGSTISFSIIEMDNLRNPVAQDIQLA